MASHRSDGRGKGADEPQGGLCCLILSSGYCRHRDKWKDPQ